MDFRDELIAGNPALDFVNTLGGKRGIAVTEKLNAYANLLDWAEAAGVLDRAACAALKVEALRKPALADRALVEARRLRELIHEVFQAIARGHAPPRAALNRLGEATSTALSRATLDRTGDHYAWRWKDFDLGRLNWQIAKAASDLLIDGRLERLKECHSGTCGWLFLDLSKNGSRRWCDMQVCGNRAKVRRYRERFD